VALLLIPHYLCIQSSIFPALYLFLRFLAARPAFAGKPYIIDTLSAGMSLDTINSTFIGPFKNHTSLYYNCLAFHIRDPDPLTNATAACQVNWPANVTTSEAWRACTPSSLSVRLIDWIDVNELCSASRFCHHVCEWFFQRAFKLGLYYREEGRRVILWLENPAGCVVAYPCCCSLKDVDKVFAAKAFRIFL
jgi:hypothetical protein